MATRVNTDTDNPNEYVINRRSIGWMTIWCIQDREGNDCLPRVLVDREHLTVTYNGRTMGDAYLATAFAECMRQASQFLLRLTTSDAEEVTKVRKRP